MVAGLLNGGVLIPPTFIKRDRSEAEGLGRRVIKTRYLVPLGSDLVVELDVYAGDLDGLLTAEIEFPSEQASAAFEPPGWLGPEITGDERYANQSLALRGPPPPSET